MNGATNRVALDKLLNVRSVNGAQVTMIEGSNSVRCVYLIKGTTLSGFTLTKGVAGAAGGGTLNGCAVTGNSDGVWGCTLNNCTVSDNWTGASECNLDNCAVTANSGIGAYSSSLNNCTVSGNSGGGAYWSTLNNCIMYFNTGAGGVNYDGSSMLNYCCTTPLPPNGVGNISLDPRLSSLSHLSAGSPCRDAGHASYASGRDIDGEAWANPPSMGCDEYHSGTVTGPLNVGIKATFTTVAVGFQVGLTGLIEGRTANSVWDFDDGDLEINEPYTSHAWEAPGDYVVSLWAFNESHPRAVIGTLTVHVVAGVHYVAAGSTNPVAPYTSWATAARSIQAAIDTAVLPGERILVTNGVYGTIHVPGLLTVRSVNGARFTVISGGHYNRCAYLASGASLSGFTLTQGQADEGAGVYCESSAAVVSNCVIQDNGWGNYFYHDNLCLYGGGAYRGTLNNCILVHNSVNASALNQGGGGWGYANFVAGGGAYESTLNNCTLSGNSAIPYYERTVRWCGGGGGEGGANIDVPGGGWWCWETIYIAAYGAGAYNCVLNNSIILDGTSESSLNHCCTGNALLDSGLRLQANSPCINTGDNASVVGSIDLDGRPRVVGGTVDIGAYEFQAGVNGQFIAWLQQYGLSTDGSADDADTDRDGLNNRQEWLCSSDPTSALSALRLLAPVTDGTNVAVTWQSAVGVNYFLERSTNLATPGSFTALVTNVPGQAGTTTYTDTNAIGRGPFFYRVAVQN
jgi:hypothetical protein